jgi:hypothetical protein
VRTVIERFPQFSEPCVATAGAGKLGSVTDPMQVPRFYVRQKITFMVNRYQIFGANSDGSEGPLLACAQQERMAFTEQVTFYVNELKSRRVFSFKARQRLDVHAEHDVFDDHGTSLGYLSACGADVGGGGTGECGVD